MDLSDIAMIRTLARTGSLSAAASELNQSQPTLSRKLSRLEDELKVALFHRTPKGLTPTAMTDYVVSKAAPLAQKLREIERQVELMSNLGQGRLSIGVGPIIEQILLPGVLSRFVETTGDVSLSIVTEDDRTLMHLFDTSAVDIVVGPFRANEELPRGHRAIPMATEDIVAVGRWEHPIFRKKNMKAEQLKDYDWAAPKRQGSTRLAKGGPALPTPKIHTDNYDLCKRLILSSNLLCAAPRSVFRDELASKKLRQVDVNLQLTWESALIIREETLLAPMASHLVSLFEEEAQTVRGD